MISAATQAALLRGVTEASIELAEDLHDRSVDADALATIDTAEAISGLGGTIALLAQTATAIAQLSRASDDE
jgi:hypothetical protein